MLAALTAGLVLAAGAASAPAPTSAVRVAKQHVVARLHISGLSGTFSLRSRRDPRWALVDGFYAKPGRGLWAAWLRLRDGRWRVVYAGLNTRASKPPRSAGVPCDLWPSFSEPSC